MNPEHWRRVEHLYHEALARPVEQRDAYLLEASEDEAVRREVASLLAQAPSERRFLETPALAVAAAIGPSPGPSRLQGQAIGTYRLQERIGAGGMGEVYRARDTKLGRDVAIKILPHALSTDPDRLARFAREARVLAALNHPNVAIIHGLEEREPSGAEPALQALVMELVEGETLAARISRGPIPLAEALGIARQIAEALDAAHERGIVHRDLKPANVKVRPDGSVKVLDFGLAKTVEIAPVAESSADSPTITSPAVVSGAGVILGTAAYMSPEQARGRPVDKRSDVWSFGCVLYEMLTGRRAFEGEDVADTLSRVLQREPDFAALPETTPPGVRKLVVRCLEKDRNRRLAHIAVASFQIDEALSGVSPGVPDTSEAAPARRTTVPKPALYATAIAGILAGAAAAWWLSTRQPAVAPPVTRLQMSVSPAEQIGGNEGRPTRPAFAVSPDGRTIVFSALQNDVRALYVRPLDRTTATMIPGTDGALNPFFSPDGAWIGYWASRQIRKVPLAGGPPVLVVPAPNMFGASWGSDDRIVFARGAGGLLEVSSAGGTPTELTTLAVDRGESSHRLPHVLPGGDAVLFTVTHNRFPRWDETQVWVYSRRTGESKLLIEGGADARYVPSGHLLYVKEGALLAVPFDLRTLAITGGAIGVVPDVMQAAYVAGQNNDTGAMQASVSDTGTLVYIPGGMHRPPVFSIALVDRSGREELLSVAAQEFRTLRLSPDGARLALSTVGRERGTWLYDFERGTLSRLVAAGRSAVPIWADNERITYAAPANGPDGLYWTRADGGGSPEVLFTSSRALVPGSWTPDGRLLYYAVPADATNAPSGPAILAQGRDEQEPASPVAESVVLGGGIDVSPDGRWVAYHSSESGQSQVYVDAYPGPGPRFQISTNGGFSPIWHPGGRELFYVEPTTPGASIQAGPVDVRLMAVTVVTLPAMSFGRPRQLFAGRYSMNGPARGYDVTRDGQRFLLLKEQVRPPDVVSEMTVVQNWTSELE